MLFPERVDRRKAKEMTMTQNHKVTEHMPPPLSVRVASEMETQLRRRAVDEERTVSSLIRLAIRRYLEEPPA